MARGRGEEGHGAPGEVLSPSEGGVLGGVELVLGVRGFKLSVCAEIP